jgi:hypothetical protein
VAEAAFLGDCFDGKSSTVASEETLANLMECQAARPLQGSDVDKFALEAALVGTDGGCQRIKVEWAFRTRATTSSPILPLRQW